MKRFNLNGKAVCVSECAPKDIHMIWVEMDSDLMTIKDVKEWFNTTGAWTSILKYNEAAMEEVTKTISENGTTVITPSTGKSGISKVTVVVNVTPENPPVEG